MKQTLPPTAATTAPRTGPIKPDLIQFFAALAERLRADDDAFEPRTVTPFAGDTKHLGKLLLNSWGAEYALRITPVVNDEQYLQSSLQWTFPQAYYSAMFSARAFLDVQGENTSFELIIQRKIAHRVLLDYYPRPLSFYALGEPTNYRVRRLGNAPVLEVNLKVTRHRLMEAERKRVQNNPRTAIRNQQTGKPLGRFGAEQYRQIAPKIGPTTFFDVIARLRISGDNNELEEARVTTGFDARLLHNDLVTIVSYINHVHEQYVRRAIGEEAWAALIGSLPQYLQEGFLAERHPAGYSFHLLLPALPHA